MHACTFIIIHACMYIYIYMCVCVCVRACVCIPLERKQIEILGAFEINSFDIIVDC